MFCFNADSGRAKLGGDRECLLFRNSGKTYFNCFDCIFHYDGLSELNLQNVFGLPWNRRPSGEKVFTPRSAQNVDIESYNASSTAIPYSERVKNMPFNKKM